MERTRRAEAWAIRHNFIERPWKNGSNMDINELQEGSVLFIPVFLKGGLIWTGDSHCRQGNGEVNLTALECSYKEIEMQPIVHHDMKLEWPRIETPTHYIMVGFDEDLNVAMANAVKIHSVSKIEDSYGGLFENHRNQFFNASMNKAMASVPVTINNFAMQPYPNLQRIAWAGVFLITLGVLGLNIAARVFFRKEK